MRTEEAPDPTVPISGVIPCAIEGGQVYVWADKTFFRHPPRSGRSMKTFSMMVSTSARSAQWQLAGFLGTSTSVLCGWQQAPRAVDDGVPEEVAGVLSRALCRCAQVSFLFSKPEDIAKTYQKECYSFQPIREQGLFALQIARWWSGRPSHLVVVSSNEPKVVFHLFDDGYFSWVLQGQTVFLSSLSEPAPDLRDVLSKAWREKYEEAPLRAVNDYALTGVMRPGVDGDAAGFLFNSVAHKECFLDALREEAESSGMDFKVRNETEFMNSLAGESVDASRYSEH